MTQEKLQQNIRIEDLTFGDEYLFEEVLIRNKDITIQLLERITGVTEITHIDYISKEDVQTTGANTKGIRCDVYVKDQDGVAYIVELQRRDTKEIPKRMRYYQTTSDSRQLPKGGKYKDLKDNYVIFICREDIFGHGLYKYTFRNRCDEISNLTLDDGTHKIVLNTQGNNDDACSDVVDFLNLIEGVASDTPLIKQIEMATEEIKDDEIWREKRMQSDVREQDAIERLEETLERGLQQGIESKAIEVARKMLADGLSVENVAKYSGLDNKQIEKLI